MPASAQKCVQVWDHLQEAQWRKSDLGGQADDQVFARIEQDVDVLCSMLDAVFRHAGLGSSVEDVHETKLSLTSLDGVVLESRHSKLNPFDFRTVEGTVWRSFREGRVKLTNDRVLVSSLAAVGMILFFSDVRRSDFSRF
jgi:hypothetical protein